MNYLHTHTNSVEDVCEKAAQDAYDWAQKARTWSADAERSAINARMHRQVARKMYVTMTITLALVFGAQIVLVFFAH